MSSIWDDPEIQATGNFVTFANVGDAVSGEVLKISRQTFQNKDGESVAPQLLLRCDDGEERTLTAGQIRLKLALVEQRPEVGDHVAITLTEIEKRGGGRTLKHFDVKVTRGGEKPKPAAKAAARGADSPPF